MRRNVGAHDLPQIAALRRQDAHQHHHRASRTKHLAHLSHPAHLAHLAYLSHPQNSMRNPTDGITGNIESNGDVTTRVATLIEGGMKR